MNTMKMTRCALPLAILAAVLSWPARPDGAEKLSIAMLYDVTLSHAIYDLPRDQQLADAMSSLASQIKSGDIVRFGSIAVGLRLTGPLGPDARKRLRSELPVVPDRARYGPSPLCDAMYETVTALASDPGRRVILIVTDGMSTGNVHSTAELIAHAKEHRVSISAIVRGGTGMNLDDKTANQLVWPGETFGTISQATGGVCLSMSGGTCQKPGKGGAITVSSRVTMVMEALRK